MLSPTYSNVFTNNKGTTNNNSIIMEDKKHKHTTQTRTAWYLTIATLALVALTTISVHTLKYTTMYNNDEQLRFLDENNNNDYSDQTCDDIFTMTEPSSDQRCLFAQTCNSNQGLQFSFIFCNKFNLSTTTWIIILSPFLLIWLVLLFRMLGSTAEDFFSPSLEMFSVKMGLPPRFAGVTLLALGNGAADVSATINAISQNPAEGYLMSLGALTGAGMFVGTVVAGIVIVIADGVKCRGALVRDVLMFIITLGVVYAFFNNGKIGSNAIHTFLWMYAAFVIVVLVADIYHRAVVLPRMRKLNEDTMVLSNSDENQLSAIDNNDDTDESSNPNNERQDQSTRKVSFAPSEEAGDVELASPNNLLVAPDDLDENDKGLGRSILERSHTESFSDHPDVSENNMKTKGSKPKKTNNISKVQKGVDKIMVALSNYGPNEGNPNNRSESFKGWTGGLQVTSESSDKPIKFHGQHGILNSRSSDDYLEDEESVSDNRPFSGPAASYRILLENVDNICTVDGSLSSGLNISWGDSLSTGLNEFSQHFLDYFNDIFANSDNNVFDKFFLCWELPFTVLRKITVPIPCDDYYCRGLVAISFALSPLWLGVYSFFEKDANLFFTGGFPWIECLSIFTVLIAMFIMKFAPEEEVDLSLTVSVSIFFSVLCSLLIYWMNRT